MNPLQDRDLEVGDGLAGDHAAAIKPRPFSSSVAAWPTRAASISPAGAERVIRRVVDHNARIRSAVDEATGNKGASVGQRGGRRVNAAVRDRTSRRPCSDRLGGFGQESGSGRDQKNGKKVLATPQASHDFSQRFS